MLDDVVKHIRTIIIITKLSYTYNKKGNESNS